MNTFERLLKVFSAVFDGEIDTKNISLNSNLRQDVEINSIGLLYMAMAIEEEFGIKFNNEDFLNISTISDVVNIIEEKAAI
ncbi:MAG: acyl carrier protein [Clostridia bacterium]|nr:acyl carrier protein [Clostridia bacterium]